jgi:hypothetical protein
MNALCPMSSLRLHLATAVLFGALALASGSGCRASQQAQLNVLSVEKSASPTGDRVVYVEVVNRARRPMRLQRLQYTFAASGNRGQLVELELGRRLVEAGSAVVVEVPLTMADAALGTTITLAGKLWAEQDEIVKSFAVAAEIATDDGSRL